MMAVMARETWTDERLDDLNKKVGDGFAELREELRAIRHESRSSRRCGTKQAKDAGSEACSARERPRTPACAGPVPPGQTTNLPFSCMTSPSTSSLPPRRRSQTRSVWTADSLTPPDSG
jgi:hypothetical protein